MALMLLDDVVDLLCAECGHPGSTHLPSAVTAFGRGMCVFDTCGCSRYAAPAGTPALTDYTPFVEQPGCRYGLVVHRGTREHLVGGYAPPELVTWEPTVDRAVYRLVGHHAFHSPGTGAYKVVDRFFYADWGGGQMSTFTEHTAYISRCGCRAISHGFGERELVGIAAALGPLLAWTTHNTTRQDWCELVPVPAPDTVHRGRAEFVEVPDGRTKVVCPRGHRITITRPGEPWAGSELDARFRAGWDVECDRRGRVPGWDQKEPGR